MRKQQSKRAPSSSTGPKRPPVVIQLPGGVTVKGFAFRITKLDAHGRAVEFELTEGEDFDCVLWATPEFLAQPLPADIRKRVLGRIEESIEGKQYVTSGSEVATPTAADDDYANDEDLDEE